MKMITAVIRTTSLERIVATLEKIGVTSMTICQVKGMGDHVGLSGSVEARSKVDVIVSEDHADTVARLIADTAHTGTPGDGIVTVTPLDYLLEIRSGKKEI